MKKVTLLSLVLILLAFLVVPVMAAGPNNGHGNGGSAGQGNGNGNQDQTRQQDQDRQQNRGRNANNGVRGNGNREHTRMRTPFYLQGTITAIDTGAMTLTVKLIHGNAQVKQYFDTGLTVKVSEDTLIFKLTQGEETEGTEGLPSSTSSSDDETPGNRVPITFDKLEGGQKVAIHGNVVDGIFNARLITVYIQMAVGQPVIEKP